jgi:uncharacterized protein YbjT (DUF2867 family)
VKVITKYPELLEESNWNCGCPEPHSYDEKRVTVIPVKSYDNIESYFKGSDGVVCCLGNRQPFYGHNDAYDGTQAVLKSMKANHIQRLVVLSSTGVEEDWPPMEFHWSGKIFGPMLLTCSRAAFRDLTDMERAVRASEVDYLIVRPVGIGEDVAPVNQWKLQGEKYKDVIGFNMAKMDVARFMVQEAIEPTKHKEAVTIGAVMEE